MKKQRFKKQQNITKYHLINREMIQNIQISREGLTPLIEKNSTIPTKKVRFFLQQRIINLQLLSEFSKERGK